MRNVQVFFFNDRRNSVQDKVRTKTLGNRFSRAYIVKIVEPGNEVVMRLT